MSAKDWSPEGEDDPGEIAKEQLRLQKEQLALGKRFMEKADKAEAEAEAKAQAERNAGPPMGPGVYLGPPGYATTTYKPPSFEEVSDKVKRAWDEVKRVVPDAPDQVKFMVFNLLIEDRSGGQL